MGKVSIKKETEMITNKDLSENKLKLKDNGKSIN